MSLPPLVGAQRRMTRRLGAIVLGSQAPVVLFGAVGALSLIHISLVAPTERARPVPSVAAGLRKADEIGRAHD